MNATPTEQASMRYYDNHEGVGVWGALFVGISVISVAASLAAHSWVVTFCVMLGEAAVWYLGYWTLSKSSYFISSTKAGFKDLFRAREVQFDEVQSVTRVIGHESRILIFACKTRTVSMPLDVLDERWFFAVKAELHKRGIPLSCSVGFRLKQK